MEALGTVALLALFGLAATWACDRGLVYELVPSFRAVKHGPPGFPLTIEIQRAGLKVSNGTIATWRACQITIGARPPFGTTFDLGPRMSVELPYDRFVSAEAVPVKTEGYRQSRDRIAVQCTDASGRQHLMFF